MRQLLVSDWPSLLTDNNSLQIQQISHPADYEVGFSESESKVESLL